MQDIHKSIFEDKVHKKNKKLTGRIIAPNYNCQISQSGKNVSTEWTDIDLYEQKDEILFQLWAFRPSVKILDIILSSNWYALKAYIQLCLDYDIFCSHFTEHFAPCETDSSTSPFGLYVQLPISLLTIGYPP